ncbi:MAG: DUF4837 family protein [Bacteroidales bacterium]|nr:DUF4837 family protein [Bacteroidales bacterium]
MKRHLIIIIGLVLSFATTSCEQKNGPARKDRSSGGTAEILIVTQNDEQWKGTIGETLQCYFCAEQYGLPQPESKFNLAHVNVSGFSDLFKKHKCILEVEINPNIEFAKTEVAEDMWAAPQQYVKITAPNLSDWVEQFGRQKELLMQKFYKTERERIMSVLRPTVDNAIVDAIGKKFGFTMTVPQGFFIGKSEPDFMWIRKELERSSSCLLIYQTPYIDTAQFTEASLIAFRERMVNQHIPGPTEGSYMSTDTVYEPPLASYPQDFPAGYAVELRGRWRVEHEYMGGPFISYSFLNPNNGNLVTVEGFYYEPNQKKRNQILQLQAIMYSLRFVENE